MAKNYVIENVYDIFVEFKGIKCEIKVIVTL